MYKDRQKYLEAQLRYNGANRERRRLYAIEWRKKNKEKKRAYDKIYFLTYKQKPRKNRISKYHYIPVKHKEAVCIICNKKFIQKICSQVACSQDCIKTKDRFFRYKGSARRRNLMFELSLKEFLDFLNKNCFYCGIGGKMGIDRCDNNKGYITGNLVSCCWNCNRFKNILSSKAYINICKMVASFNL